MKINKVLIAITVGMVVSWGGQVEGKPDDPFIKKSDVFFTQPRWDEMEAENQGKYSDYGVDATMWGFLPPTYPSFNFQTNFESSMSGYVNGIINHDLAGIDWVSRIEWDVIWDGMITKYPDTYEQAMVKRLDGSNLEIDWFAGHYFFSTHEPLFREYVEWQIRDVAFYGDDTGPGTVDAILFDSQQTTPAHYYWGGDFSDGCMANFNTWLTENYTTSELAALGIPDINTFHYGDFLKALGYTAMQYESETVNIPNDIELNNEYRHFLQDWNNTYLAELVKFTDNIAQQKGYPYQEGIGYIEVGTSSPLLDPYWNGIRMPFNDEFDFYVQEFNHRASDLTVSSDVMLMYKLAEAIDKPLALTAQPFPDWNYMVDNPGAVDLVRSWIAQAYANGATFMTPEHMWSYQGALQRYYDPAVGDYDYLYAWIGEKSFLLDGFESVAKVGLVYSHNAYRESQYDDFDVFAAAAGLMEQNIPYKLLIAGDDWWPKYLTDVDQSSAMDDFSVIVKTDFNGMPLDTAQADKLGSYGTKVVTWPDTASIYSLLPEEMSVDVAQVALFPRDNAELNAGMNNAPRIMHLVNRDFNAGTASINPKSNLTVTVNDSLFAGVSAGFVGAAYSQAGQATVHLNVSYSNGVTTVTVPSLTSWGIIELYTKAGFPCEDNPELCVPIEKETRTELFEVNLDPNPQGYVFFDGEGDSNEKIQRFEQNWAWGGYSAGGEISQNTQWTGLVQFQNGAKAGSRIYTRLDTQTSLTTTSKANKNSYEVDMSADDAAIVLNIATAPAQNWALLIRDNNTWWQSSTLAIPALGWDSLRTDRHAVHDFTWTALDSASTGVIDMDEVDDGGEAPITLGTSGTPNYSRITGFGVIALEDSNTVMSMMELGIYNSYFNIPQDEAIDTDGDGYSDEDEIAAGSDPLDASSTPMTVDSDGDGFTDVEERAAGSDENDAGETPLNLDSDGDGYTNVTENAADSDPYNAAKTPINFDGDSCVNIEDVFPRDASECLDFDNDTIGDNADLDDDNDGFSDVEEAAAGSDPFDANETPLNLDSDGDGFTNLVEIAAGSDPFDANSVPDTTDSDGDGYTDTVELAAGSDPADAASTPVNFDGDSCPNATDAFPTDATECSDFDNDGLGDNADQDDDGDGYNDDVEIAAGSDPLNASETPDNLDSDGDGFSNVVEVAAGSDPYDASETPINLDSDGDGYTDVDEVAAGSDPFDANSIPSIGPLVYITETFDNSIIPGQMFNLDNTGNGDEYIGRFSKGWAWGGYTSGAAITHNTQWGGIVQFQGGAKAGSRIYTRFDTASSMNGSGNSNVSTISVDISDNTAKLVLNIAESPGQNIAMLVRDDQGWWQSSSITLPALGYDANRSNNNVNINTLTWQKLDANHAAVIDMDSVNQGGESMTPSPVNSASSINLHAVTGFGIIALENKYSFLSINKLGLGNVAVTQL